MFYVYYDPEAPKILASLEKLPVMDDPGHITQFLQHGNLGKNQVAELRANHNRVFIGNPINYICGDYDATT